MTVKIDHIALYVNDLEGAKRFFETYFHAVANEGYHNEKTDFRSYFLTFSDGSRLEIMTKPDLTDSAIFLTASAMPTSPSLPEGKKLWTN